MVHSGISRMPRKTGLLAGRRNQAECCAAKFAYFSLPLV